jgi:3-phenylpropionate/trans-cinnamate dioxygenase ferredoxin subunit
MIDVAALEHLEEGVPTKVMVEGRGIVLVRWGTEVLAARDLCPHQLQSFDGGRVHPRVVGDGRPGEVAIAPTGPVLACPWHSWEFDLRDGSCTVDPTLRVRIYRVEVRDGRVLVELQRVPSPASSRD